MQPDLPPQCPVLDDILNRLLPMISAAVACVITWQVFSLDAMVAPSGNGFAVFFTFMALGVLLIVGPMIIAPIAPTWSSAVDYMHNELPERVFMRLAEFFGIALFMCYLANVPYGIVYGLLGSAWTYKYWRTVIRRRLVDSVGRSAMSTAVALFIAACLSRHFGWSLPAMWSRVFVISILAALVAGITWMSET